jgi:NADP-reducing hydrogenase subunit HndB
VEGLKVAKMTIEDLKKIKESKRGVVNLREGRYRVKLTVHMGTCGIAAGARTVMNALLAKIEEDNVNDVILTSSGCAGLCVQEPMITVEVKGSSPVKYAKIDGKKATKIFEEHVLQGRHVPEYVLSEGSETTY